MEILNHIRPYFAGIFPYIGLTQALYGRYLQFRFLKWPLIYIYIFKCIWQLEIPQLKMNFPLEHTKKPRFIMGIFHCHLDFRRVLRYFCLFVSVRTHCHFNGVGPIHFHDFQKLPSGKLTQRTGKYSFLIGKTTSKMAIFNYQRV